VEPDQGDLKDDSSLNAVQLECFNSHDQYVGSAASLVGEKGDWKSDQYCGSQSFINGVRFRSERSSIAILDKTAGNNIDVTCDNGQILYGDGLYWGDWSGWVYCPADTVVCGLQTRVQPYGGTLIDDTGLNEIILDCCTF